MGFEWSDDPAASVPGNTVRSRIAVQRPLVAPDQLLGPEKAPLLRSFGPAKAKFEELIAVDGPAHRRQALGVGRQGDQRMTAPDRRAGIKSGNLLAQQVAVLSILDAELDKLRFVTHDDRVAAGALLQELREQIAGALLHIPQPAEEPLHAR